ncbi:acyl-CoA dehydrogenase family protein [Aquisalibacillus elongatus]|uniref:Alkylation response protein AidB-like acyl-CoA dehydrogenase n=1 Tax=Aquisalibacillus elongatus TaxID=485577 RepID=A0A3N5AYP3_9BACI|nr:acyl-CoA dehydrogenase family protein [Aquisalibacillus elongatus]RPF50376.1 alkylation response protein AidB-like acyl-CoA dehydrogenase [Aquisalibacillus elongatus]
MARKNFYKNDPVIQRLMKQYLSDDFYQYADDELDDFGERVANEIDERAVHTDREGQPRLIKYNKMGEEINHIWVNEGYLKTVEETYNTGIVGYVHKDIPELGHKGNYMYSYAQGYLLSKSEPGFYCPVTLTMATAYLIDHYADEELKRRFLPHVLSTGDVELYEGATFLTERQGGSDVGANVVEAVEDGGCFRLYGEKYFASNSGMCGVTMVLSRMEGAPAGTKGLSLFLVPWEENRKANQIKVRRLKDKLGVRAVPSAEIEFEGAKAYLVGDAKKGFKYMMEALNLSRVCNSVASLGIMRRAYDEARDYAINRDAFGHKLTNYPMIQDTLVQLATKLEVETYATFDVVHLFDHVMAKGSDASEQERALLRLYIAIMKKETAEQAIEFSHESIEMHGGNGYIEDFVTSRLLRDAQVLTVWEGTANILGLEVLRLIHNFNVHELFVRDMHERLEELSPQLSELKQPVVNALGQIKQSLEELAQMDQEAQLMYPKHLAKDMSDIFEAVVALQQVQEGEIYERDVAVAEVFIEQTFNSRKYQLNPLSLKHFDLIVNAKNPVST